MTLFKSTAPVQSTENAPKEPIGGITPMGKSDFYTLLREEEKCFNPKPIRLGFMDGYNTGGRQKLKSHDML